MTGWSMDNLFWLVMAFIQIDWYRNAAINIVERSYFHVTADCYFQALDQAYLPERANIFQLDQYSRLPVRRFYWTKGYLEI